MAKAPSKTAARRARNEQADDDDFEVELTWRGRPLRLAMSQLGPGDDAVCRAQTARVFGAAYPFQGYMSLISGGNQFGTDILVVLLWMARRKNGEPELQLQAVLDDVPTNSDLTRDLQLGPAPKSSTDPLDVAEAAGEGEPPGD